jgi:hypothetical protein
MVTLDQLRDYMRKQVADDRSKKSVQVSGDSVEDALHQASIELGLPVNKLEYEVLERGSRGVMGAGKRSWMLIAYEAEQESDAGDGEDAYDSELDLDTGAEPLVVDSDGQAVVRLASDGAYLKVVPPAGRGKKATVREAIGKLHERAVRDVDEGVIGEVVKRAEGVFVRVGEFIYNPANDAVMTVDITDLEMKGFMTANPPGPGGADLSVDSMKSMLKNNGIVYGVKDEVLESFESNPTYGMPVLVAEGVRPVHGEDARINFAFETDHSKVQLKEKNGRVDFKELNLVQNVVEGQVLAKRVPPDKGSPGRTVTGKVLPAKPGRDVQIDVGKNVKISEDGSTATAAINGQVMLLAGRISVEPVYVVPGDVNLRTGNILFLGTVVVKGNVEDGFSVKAAGNIEIMGNVGKCTLDAEGDVIVHQGITGKSGGYVKSGQGVWAKFIENAHIEAGGYVVVSDGIINSQVDSNLKIVCKGKRATIVGGHLRAAEEINAKTLGSIAGSETILEVGYDPKSKERLAELETQREELDNEMEEVDLNLHTLENLKKVRKKLPPDKIEFAKELITRKKDLAKQIQKSDQEMNDIQSYLASLKNSGKVSASGKVFAGVRVIIKDARLDVRNEFKSVTFVQEANAVKVTKYEALEEEITRRV